MKRMIATIFIIILVIAGLSLMLYPTVSDYLKTLAFKRAIYRYESTVSEIDEETYDDILAAARAFNEKIASRGAYSPELSEADFEDYMSQLNVPGSDVMGYVIIKKISVSLPIYHGTSDAVLQSGIGHLEGSSLPIGGESTHAVVSGHTGLPSAMLFTNIDRLVEGDTFTVRVLNETLTYEVDQILRVLPHEMDALNIEKGEDYCTLVTCWPYGVNTHRLLVRGHRIETPEEDVQTNTPTAANRVETVRESHLTLIIFIAVLVLIILVVLIILAARPRSS